MNLLRINLLVLLVVALLPFPTRLITDALRTGEGQIVNVTTYGLTILAIRLLGSALDAYARNAHLYTPSDDDQELRGAHRRLLPAVIGYVIAIVIGLFFPAVAVALYFGMAVYLIVPIHRIVLAAFRRAPDT
jgi:TMEM175 potassium channel family protein